MVDSYSLMLPARSDLVVVGTEFGSLTLSSIRREHFEFVWRELKG
jgi:hypothetical protein